MVRISFVRTPKAEFPRHLNAAVVVDTFRSISSICCLHRSLLYIVTPRYLHVGFGLITPHLVCSGVVSILDLLL